MSDQCIIHPVVLCGGSGTRLWPRSRQSRPKPFLPLVGTGSLFEATLDRCSPAAGFAAPIVVTGQAHLEHVDAQLSGGLGGEVIVEPCARNTAPAIALAALRLPEEAVMLVCPSDHHIADIAGFQAAAHAAAALASAGWLVAFGIEAQAPETGFGYLKRGEALSGSGFRVARFCEKPDRARAEQFLAEGGYAWNGGIFAFRAGTFLAELASHRPQIATMVRRAVADGKCEGARFYPDTAAFSACESESVDYAVMESTPLAAMVPANIGWSDIGNWDAVLTARHHDAAGNSARGRAELIDCRNVLIESDGPRVSAIGLEDVMIVVDGDEVLVTTRSGARQVGKLSGAANQ